MLDAFLLTQMFYRLIPNDVTQICQQLTPNEAECVLCSGTVFSNTGFQSFCLCTVACEVHLHTCV